jgi:hypothetical protein
MNPRSPPCTWGGGGGDFMFQRLGSDRIRSYIDEGRDKNAPACPSLSVHVQTCHLSVHVLNQFKGLVAVQDQWLHDCSKNFVPWLDGSSAHNLVAMAPETRSVASDLGIRLLPRGNRPRTKPLHTSMILPSISVHVLDCEAEI